MDRSHRDTAHCRAEAGGPVVTLREKALSFAGTTSTVFANFWPWLLAAYLLGLGSGAYPSYQVTRAFFERATLKAENELAEWQATTAQARLDAKAREDKIMADAKGVHDEQVAAIAGLADELRRLSAGVRVCTQVSSMRLSPAAAGPSQAAAGTEPRPADVVLQELAAEFAHRADDNAAAYNSLMERWEKVAKPME